MIRQNLICPLILSILGATLLNLCDSESKILFKDELVVRWQKLYAKIAESQAYGQNVKLSPKLILLSIFLEGHYQYPDCMIVDPYQTNKNIRLSTIHILFLV